LQYFPKKNVLCYATFIHILHLPQFFIYYIIFNVKKILTTKGFQGGKLSFGIRMLKKMTQNENELDNQDKNHKIQFLCDMINSAERTIQSAKAMLLQLEGKKKTGRRKKTESEAEETIVEGTFDGQLMNSIDGKQYPVPANYASKSKLVEGDMLKLIITPDGSFIYKQIGPIERKHALGIVSQDENGNYYIIANGKTYRVLLASITYFRVEPGDEVAIILPRDIDTSWAAIENILQKGRNRMWQENGAKFGIDKEIEIWKKEFKESQKEEPPKNSAIVDEWTSNIKEFEDEIKSDLSK